MVPLTLLGLLVLGACAVLVSPPGPDATQDRGRQLYNANCFSCHGGVVGGAMMDYPPRHNERGHTWHHPDCELKTVIRDGSTPMTEAMRRMMAPPDAPRMPAWRGQLSEEEIDLVLAFIKTMWNEEQRRYQAQITRQQC